MSNIEWGEARGTENVPAKEHPDFSKNVLYAQNFIQRNAGDFLEGFRICISGIIVWIEFRYKTESDNIAKPICFHQSIYDFQAEFRENFNEVYSYCARFWASKQKEIAKSPIPHFEASWID